MSSGSDGFWKLLGTVSVAGRRRASEVLERRARDRVDQILGNDVAGERVLLEPSAANRAPRERVVNLVLRSKREQLREIAVAHLLGRHGRRAVVARPRLVDALESIHEERLAAAVIAGKDDRAAGHPAVAVVAERRQRDVVGVGEEVVGKELARRFGNVDRAAQPVGAGLDHQVRHATFGVAGGGVEGRSLDLEFLNDVGRWDVGRDDLTRVGGSRARHAVDRQIAAVASRPIHRVADDVRGLEGSVEAPGPGVSDASGQADEGIGITVWRRQLHDPARVDDVAERSVGGFEERRVRQDGHRLDGLADGEREVDLEPIGDADLDLTCRLLEALKLGVHLIDAGNQVGSLIEADFVRDDGDGGAHLLVGDGDGRSRDDAAARIANRAGDRSARVLCRDRRGERERDNRRGREREGTSEG